MCPKLFHYRATQTSSSFSRWILSWGLCFSNPQPLRCLIINPLRLVFYFLFLFLLVWKLAFPSTPHVLLLGVTFWPAELNISYSLNKVSFCERVPEWTYNALLLTGKNLQQILHAYWEIWAPEIKYMMQLTSLIPWIPLCWLWDTLSLDLMTSDHSY